MIFKYNLIYVNKMSLKYIDKKVKNKIKINRYKLINL